MGSYRGGFGGGGYGGRGMDAGSYAVNALRGMAIDKERSERNALEMEGQQQTMDAKQREEKAKQMWVMGKAFEGVKDDEGYQKVKSLRKDLFGEEGMEAWPESHDPEFTEKMKFRTNVGYDFITKGKEKYLPKSEAEWTDIERQEKLKLKGKTRKVQKGGKETTEEHDGEGWKEIASGPKWNPNAGETKPLTPTQIREKIATARKNKLKIETSGAVDSAVIGLLEMASPGSAGNVMKKIDPGEAVNALDDLIEGLESQLPGGKKKRKKKGKSYLKFLPKGK